MSKNEIMNKLRDGAKWVEDGGKVYMANIKDGEIVGVDVIKRVGNSLVTVDRWAA